MGDNDEMAEQGKSTDCSVTGECSEIAHMKGSRAGAGG